MDNTVLSILIVEDDIFATNELVQCIEKYKDLKVVATTNNSYKALDLARSYLPNVILLDLELHHGGGNGLLFLNALKEHPLSYQPYILVTTNNMSTVTLDQAKELGADFTLTKYEMSYSAQYVVDTIRMSRNAIIRKNNALSPMPNTSPARDEQLISIRIQREMDLIGIKAKAKGYNYLIDSILLLIQGFNGNLARELAPKYHKSEDSIERAMQNAIIQAWTTSCPDDLLQHYTARIRSDKGHPTMMEFIYYYSTKVKNDMDLERLQKKAEGKDIE